MMESALQKAAACLMAQQLERSLERAIETDGGPAGMVQWLSSPPMHQEAAD